MYEHVRSVMFSLVLAAPLFSFTALSGCGTQGPPGALGPTGLPGPEGPTGGNGTSGSSGTPLVKVTPGQMGTWKVLGANTATATLSMENAWPVTALGGTASVRMFPGTGMGTGGNWPAWSGSGGKAWVGTTVVNGLFLSDLTALSYSTFNIDTSGVELMPYVNVFVDLDGDGAFDKTKDDLLVFDPPYFPASAQAKVLTNRWQNWDALSQNTKSWRCVFAHAKIDSAGTLCTVDMPYSFSQLANSNLTAKVIPASCQEVPFPMATSQNTCATQDTTAPGLLFVVGQKSGQGWEKYTGYVDNVRLGIQEFEQTYNFEAQ